MKLYISKTVKGLSRNFTNDRAHFLILIDWRGTKCLMFYANGTAQLFYTGAEAVCVRWFYARANN